jgi:hypothetical protein
MLSCEPSQLAGALPKEVRHGCMEVAVLAFVAVLGAMLPATVLLPATANAAV